MKVIYICGPYSHESAWQREQNIRRAEDVAYQVAQLGCSPLCPHTNMGRSFWGTQTPEFWYQATMELMKRCDAIMTVKGWQSSRGATREVAAAEHRPVFHDMAELASWLMTEAGGWTPAL